MTHDARRRLIALATDGVRPRYDLGQSFLVDPAIIRFETERAGVSRKDTVLEIGAGVGNLTEALARLAGRVVAIELDRQFSAPLEALCARHDNVKLVWGDATTIDLPRFDKVVANLPYNVALPILFRLLDRPFRVGVLMLQESLARRLTAKPGDRGYNRVAVTASLSARIRMAKVVPRSAFFPPPDVASAIVEVRMRPAIEVPSHEQFRAILHVLFETPGQPLEQAALGLGPRGRVRSALGRLPKELRAKTVRDIHPSDFASFAVELDRDRIRVRSPRTSGPR